MNMELTAKEADILRSILRNAVDQIDEVMRREPSVEFADASNTLEGILIKLKEK